MNKVFGLLAASLAFAQLAIAGPLDRTCDYAEQSVEASFHSPEFKSKLTAAIQTLREKDECYGAFDPPERDEANVRFVLFQVMRYASPKLLIEDDDVVLRDEIVGSILERKPVGNLLRIAIEKGIVIRKDSVSSRALLNRIATALELEGCRHGFCHHVRSTIHRYERPSIADWNASDFRGMGRAVGSKDGFSGHVREAFAHGIIDRAVFDFAREIDPENELAKKARWCDRNMTIWDWIPVVNWFSHCNDHIVKISDLFNFERLSAQN